ncbi:MAG: phospholipase D-like domain-containing protein [Lachnospiraceae bacterium]|nr:phospholipase D-like domain-containing protein [Lachnospiraceae bacterium]
MKFNKREVFSIPNMMSYFRILLLPFLAAAILKEQYILQVVLMALSALTDFLDGKIARKFHMVTELGKALDPIADKLTLCLLFICLAVKNPYALVIAVVMLAKELFMGGMELLVRRKTGKTTGGATWYGKLCTAVLFLSMLLFLMMPHMPIVLSNIVMIVCVAIMIFTWWMYGFLFYHILRGKEQVKERMGLGIGLTVLTLVLYLLGGAALPFAEHKTVSDEYQKVSENQKFYSETDVTGGDGIRLVTTNEEALENRIALIKMAKKTIQYSTFDFRPDTSGTQVASLLYEAAERGVQVQILVDGYSGFLKMDNAPVFQALASHPNIQLKIYNPVHVLEPWNLMGRMHDKYVVIDDYGYMLGGRNTYDFFLGSEDGGHKNYDMEVFVQNKGLSEKSSLYQVKTYFDGVWTLPYCVDYSDYVGKWARKNVEKGIAELETAGQEMEETYPEACKPQAKERLEQGLHSVTSIQLLSNPIERENKEPWVWHSLEQLLEQASEKVYIHTPYVICDPVMYEGLGKIAQKVPDTRLIINAPENGANPFGCADYIREKQKVHDTGFTVYEYQGDASYHIKTCLMDERISIVGSFNMDMRSAYLDTELMLVVDSRELNQDLESYMLNSEKYCKKAVSMTEYDYGELVVDKTMTPQQELSFKGINFLTKWFRYLL